MESRVVMSRGIRAAATPDRLAGIGLAALAATFASSAGVLVRQVDSADAWSLLVYRSLGFVGVVALFILVRHGRRSAERFAEIGRPGLVVSLCLGGAFIAFLLALASTNVATVVAVLGASPMVAALIGWAAIGEKPALLTWLAMLAGLTGVAIVAWDGIGAGSAGGLALAVLACLGYAAAVVGLRAGKTRDMSPAICLSGVMAGGVSLLVVTAPSTATLSTAIPVVIVGLLLGSVQIGAQYILLTIAARLAPAADIALAMILEVALAPLWVWLVVGETVPAAALVGGAVIMLGLVLNAFAPAATGPHEASDGSRAEPGG